MLLIILLIILGFVLEFPELYVNDSYPNGQFAGLTYTGQWYLVSCTIASWKRPILELPWQCTCLVGELFSSQ